MFEWRRVLFPGTGQLYISVPDIDILARMLTTPNIPMATKNVLLTMIYGGHDTPFNYHRTGFYFEYLQKLLEAFDFCGVERVAEFGIFEDTSMMTIDIGDGRGAVNFSINVKARRCDLGVNSNFVCPVFS